MKIWIPSMLVEFSYGLSPGEQRKALEITKENVKLLVGKWNEFSAKKK